MATENTCSEYSRCGFVNYLKTQTGESNPDCGKNPKTCGRLDPIVPFTVEHGLPQSREEIETAFPVLYMDKYDRPRRL
jgi:hypothetical protein